MSINISDRSGAVPAALSSGREGGGPRDASARASGDRTHLHLVPAVDDAPPHGIARPFVALPTAIRLTKMAGWSTKRLLVVDVDHGGVRLRFMWRLWSQRWTRQTIAPLACDCKVERDPTVLEALYRRTSTVVRP